MKKPPPMSRIASKFSDPRNVSLAIEAQKARQRTQAAYEAPTNPTEDTLCAIWSKLLAIDKVGRNDNFFALGGHSLLAAEMLARVRSTLGVELPLKAVFESPVLGALAERIESSRKPFGAIDRPTPQPRGETTPLSFAQQRVWFIDQLEPGRPLYNVAAMYRLRGTLSVPALEKTINEIVRRHESLRTTFRDVDGQPVQVIAPELRLPLEVSVVIGAQDEQREAELQRLTREVAAQPFELDQGPLVRTRLLRVGDEDHVLMIVVHHIVFDGWSGSLVAGELAALYEAFAQGRPSPLPELPIQYADFALWQRQWLQGEVLEQQVEYWRGQLAGAPAVLELPTDRPRPALQSHRGEIRTHVIPSELIDRLQTFSQSEGVTLFMTLLAGFQLLLSRYSGHQDIVVGSNVAGRNHAEVEPLIGFFVNTMAMRTDLSGDPTCREMVARVKKVALEAYAHQDVPFEKLVDELQPERSPSYNPIYQVLFGLQNIPKRRFEASGLQIERSSVHQGTSILDMSWFAFETDAGILLRVEYSADLYDGDTIVRALEHFQNLLEGIASNPDARISELPLLGAAERYKILVEFNATETEYPRQDCVHQLFEQQAERTPDAVACVFENDRIKYRLLNERANQVAHFLQKRGVAPGQRVGIYVERSLNMMVGLLGIQKSGAAYVPLDPAYPAERLRLTLEDAKVLILLTQQSLLNEMPEHSAEVVCLDRDWPQIAQESASNPISDVRPEDLVYVIFTSGSTGRPKGVQVPHRAVVNLLSFMARELRMGPDDVFPALASFAFDMCIPELYLPLVTGGRMVLGERDLGANGEEHAALLRREGATIVHATPSTWSLLLEAGFTGKGLKRAIGAEPLPRELCVRLLEADNSLYNFYGPTETTVWSTYHHFRSPDEPVVVGRPLANTQIYILDKTLQPLPLGVPGEIYIGGDGVTCGYLNRPEMTAEKFVHDPFSNRANALMYRTGDLGSYLPDGRILFQGRVDNQVKIRGFRIELGEIEAVLEQHPGVSQAVVVAREDVPGDKRLVGYVVAENANGVSTTELRNHLGKHLPEYMTPSAFVQMAKLPLSPNGKVDRKALPAPEGSREESSDYVAPRNAVEEKLAEIWSEVLHVGMIGVHDNFFSLGGHSLLATQVVSRIRKWSQIELPLRALFEGPTIEKLGLRIAEMKVGVQALPSIQRAPRDRALPLSFAQQRLWFLDQLEPNNPTYNGPLAIRLSGSLNVEALKRSLNEIVRRHEVLRTRYVVLDDMPVQVIADEVTIEIPIEDLSGLPGGAQESEVRRMAIENGRHVFNLQTGPVLRASLLKLGEQEHVLLLNTHHIVSDGWSIWQFVRELAALYEAFMDGKPSPLPELRIQYADFAVWQRSWMESEIYNDQLSYWRKQLDGAPATLELPTDHPHRAVPSYRGSTCRVVYPRSLTDKLNELSRREGATLFMTLMAAYQALLFRYSGQEDFTVGSAIANRIHIEIEDLIGFFVNTLVLRGDLSGNPSFRELLQRVRNTALGAYSNQDLPFEKLVEELQPERDLGRLPLFQVWFVLQNAPRTAFQLSGIDITAMDVHNGTSKFDIGMFMVEKPEGLIATLEYSTEMFDDSTIQRMMEHFRILLEAIAEDPDRRIGELPLLTEQERRQVVVEWNDTHQDFLREHVLHEFTEKQAERTPDAPAIVFGDQRLTYGELNARANQVAHYLMKRGACPEALVGIYCERSADMLVGILGVLKAGSAYVPLDPNYPKQRIRHILEDAKAPIVLTQKSLADDLPEFAGQRISLDTDWSAISQESQDNPVTAVEPGNLAYVLFTSGSTGRPKGVAIEHRSVATFVHWANGVFTPEELAGVLLSTSISFDLSVFEIFVTWSTGGKVIIAENALYLPILAAKDEVTLINTVPSAMAELVRMDGVPDSVKVVNLAGEALPAALVEQIYANTAVEKVYNLYGPTEDTTYSTYTLVRRGAAVTVGRPIANSQAYILDTHLNPVPIGVAGELYLAGDGLARGYYGRADLTSERFIANPFSAEPEARMYRTGDLTRYLPDGNIEYLGRIDHQVKLRGFRIELGEIETTLDNHPGVRQSAVLAREDEPGNQRLVAYVVADPAYGGSEEAEPEEALSGQQVAQWTEAFDEAYRRGDSGAEATFNIAGWDSSYTGEAIPAEEMRVWVETTAERIRALGAKRVWEIGCGTGLLLFRVALSCEHYHGTDISQAALNFLQQQLQRVDPKLPNVTLERKAAHEFDQDQVRGQFDAVVLNSVIQYFPDLDYLMKVLEGAVELVRPGGAVFVGDVRSLPLLEAFHASVELFKAEDELGREELRRRVQKGIRQEGELLIDPEFFTAVRQRWPKITHVEIQLKRGRAHNELTRFRYDVVLHFGEQTPPRVDCAWLDWKKQDLTRESLAEILQKTQPEMLGLTNVPNARLNSEVAALEWLISEDEAASVGEWRKQLQEMSSRHAVEPEDLWSLEQELPYQVEVRASKVAADGCCDVVFRRRSARGEVADYAVPRFPGASDGVRLLASYANNPLRQRVAGKLIPQLRLWLGGKLPEYMVPSAFVLLAAMPLSANGKVNRKALPAPEQTCTDGGIDYRAPQSPVEEIVAAIFADVLRLERVGIDDNFFELGGHSLSATQVVSRIRHNLHVDLPVRTMFESPTVAGLAQAAEQRQRGDQGMQVPPIVPVPRNQRLPLSFAQQRLWVLDQIEPNNSHYNIPRAIRLSGSLDVTALAAALNGIVERHEVLRTNYQAEKGEPFQVITAQQKLQLPVIDLSDLPSPEREKEAQQMAQQQVSTPFDLARDPMMRNVLLKLDDEDHILVMVTHHIADDGWSSGILLRELTALYEAAVLGKPSPLLELPIQYADYAVWQRNWLQGEVLEQQLAYWKHQLDGAPPVLLLPTDRPRPEKPTFHGAIHRFLLPASLAEAIRTLSRQQGGTAFMTMLAAFQTLILHYTKQPDIVLGTDLANRTTVQTEALIGFFVNLLAIRTNLSGDPTFAELLGRVREVALGAYAHQDVPFDKLVEELQPERSLSHNPLVQALFVAQNTPRGATRMQGLEIHPYPLEVPSKFDMALFVIETDKGVSGIWLYNPDLFDATTIVRMAGLYQVVLEKATANPAMRLSELLASLAEEDQQHRASQHKEFQEAGLQKLKSIKRKTVTRE